MEELAALTALAACALVWGLVLFLVDVAGLLFGLGWRHFSKRRAEARRLKKADSHG